VDIGLGANPKLYSQYAATGRDSVNATAPQARCVAGSRRGGRPSPGSRR
jgi:hypothetical protein